MMDSPASVDFGGPDQAPRALRNLLAKRIAAVPSGGRIHWATYYLRDRELAHSLVDASRRGVDVRLVLEAAPRTKAANRGVEEIVAGSEGLGGSFTRRHEPRVLRHGGYKRPRLHTKLYYFSHPEPVAYIGSFNPSGDAPELMPEVIEEIRDQDCGYNLLVGFRDPTLAAALLHHAEVLQSSPPMSLLWRTPGPMRASAAGIDLFSLPSRRHPAVALLGALGTSARVRLAASHLSGDSSVRLFCGLAQRGVAVDILCNDSRRRVPESVLRRLTTAGARIRRFSHPDHIPMHSKFLLVDGDGAPQVAFGSFNWSGRSRFFNYEVGAISRNHELVSAFDAHWDTIAGPQSS